MEKKRRKKKNKTTTITLFDNKGKIKGEVSLAIGVTEETDPSLLAQAVKVFLSNQRRAKAKVKSRGEVKGSRRKIWSQKGTGRARHGDRYAPIFVGGGMAHGPKGGENYRLKMNKKMKRKAFLGALITKAKEKQIVAVDGLGKISPRTKMANALVEGIKSQQTSLKSAKKLILVLEKKEENIKRAFSNLKGKGVSSCLLDQLNPYLILKNDGLIFDHRALKVLNRKIGK